MRAVDIITKKRDRIQLTKDEINFFIQGYTNGEIPDYQASAFAMAILLNGMTAQETTDLTLAMVDSGTTQDLTGVVPIAVDKHSTGGVGDKTTLVVEPIVAACGLAVGKMSGRGLGFSGGTLDKLESIPGYRVDLSTDEFLQQLSKIKLVLTGQTGDLAPADKKLYALRDVTGTVQSIPLIASSVMSKKIAAGANAIVLDVKVGIGAFMESLKEAKELARMMVDIAKLAGRKAVAVLSDMNQPLGKAVGNAVELKEAIDTLHGKGPDDFLEHCLVIASHMLMLGNIANSEEEARKHAVNSIETGEAWKKFRELVIAQGGDVEYIDQPELIETAKYQEDINATHEGWIAEINARTVGETAVDLGAGRSKKDDEIDYSAGIFVHGNVGDRVRKGDVIFTIHCNDRAMLPPAIHRLESSIVIQGEKTEGLPLFYGVIK